MPLFAPVSQKPKFLNSHSVLYIRSINVYIYSCHAQMVRSGNSDERILWIGACLVVVLPAAAPSRDEPLQDKYQY